MLKIDGAMYTYPQFIEWVTFLVENGQTSGHRQTEDLIGFTALNLKRMERIYKTTPLDEALLQTLKQTDAKQKWYVITEAWCGDSAQSLPVLAKMAEASALIEMQILLRDDNPAWMEKYHTNESKSIPKLIAFDENNREIFTWGPRPKAAQELFLDWKANPKGTTKAEFEVVLHTWFAKDKTKSIQAEMLGQLKPILANV